MKQAVILVGGKQYVAREGETLRVDLLPAGTKELETGALLLIDGDKTTVGTPEVKGVKVKASVVEPEVKGENSALSTSRLKSASSNALVIAKNIRSSKLSRLNKISPHGG